MNLTNKEKIIGRVKPIREDKTKYLDLLWKDLVRLPTEDAMYIINWKFESLYNKAKTTVSVSTWWLTVSEDDEIYVEIEAESEAELVEKLSTFMQFKEPIKTIRETNLREVVG